MNAGMLQRRIHDWRVGICKTRGHPITVSPIDESDVQFGPYARFKSMQFLGLRAVLAACCTLAALLLLLPL